MTETPSTNRTRESGNRWLITATTYRAIVTALNFATVLVLTGRFDIAAG